MSRMGKAPIVIPKGVEVKVVGESVHVKGPKGALQESLHAGFSVQMQEGLLVVVAENNQTPAVHGLIRALIRNMVEGVYKGYEKRLSLVGVGYRAAVSGSTLDLELGFSHPTRLEIPSSVKIAVDKGTTIVVSGIDKQSVGQFAASIRAIRPPEPYKGKGVRYETERVRKKAGKAAKGKTG